MKKLDKLILGSFIGPFFLTFIVVDFILLTVNMLKYFDEIFGKGLDFMIYIELFSYFVISISPMALPLAVLLSSLMTFGNLGEHFELTAIKSSGISLLRALRPIGIFVVILTIFAYLSNNYLVPKVNLKTFSLLYDIRMKSPALDIKEGVFYAGIPNYSIKVNRKIDDVRLRDVIIYDHSEGQGNINVILADSGRMEPFFNDRYMRLTLYNGISYKEARSQRGITEKPVDFTRTNFSENQMVFNLESFQLNRTPEDLWSTNRSIKNIAQLKDGLDSMASEINQIIYYNYMTTESSYSYFSRNRKITPPEDIVRGKLLYDSLREARLKFRKERKEDSLRSVGVSASKIDSSLVALDSVADQEYQLMQDSLGLSQSQSGLDSMALDVIDEIGSEEQSDIREKLTLMPDPSPGNFENARIEEKNEKTETTDSLKMALKPTEFTPEQKAKIDSIVSAGNYKARAATVGLNNARTVKNNFSTKLTQIDNLEREYRRFQIAWFQKYTTAFACIVMFMIGAPLGAIIKKGGLGMPVLLSIIFFIVYYMLTITGEKWAKEGVTGALLGTWFSNLVLLPFGFFFLKQARKDARLFEADTYVEFFKKIHQSFKRLFSN
ncbi:membrane protein, putative [Indibacter alkaliphilus LW1]|uniref:Membrane protein, putative n=1 Tax=Indibacter alkaliphilus (strain CCUG 57479 / KCTC 22604 / LW1) TaxID=1189612 RepID=S2DIW4_INDAL|nr:LptF/LptG family permease [Indibacter alkaliphilus]EOZ98989.1 membrane protein, putative [Indibacter alkaliphilus LW1]